MTLSKGRRVMRMAGVLALMLIFVLGAESIMAHEHSGYAHDSSIGYTNTNWMGALPDNLKLSTLSIPGTHDTMAYRFSPSCNIIEDIVRTQTMTLQTQLNSGIRVLDIRLRHINDRFALHHGACFLDGYFGGDVMDVVNSFLAAHPTETILMRVKSEHNEENVTRTFNETWNWYMTSYGSRVWRGSGNATLGEVRGKIVILDQSAGVSYGLNWSSFEIQDNYDLSDNWALYGKWEDVKKQLRDATAGDKNEVYVNFLSAANGGFPYFFASGHSNPSTGAPRLSTGRTTATCGSDCYPDFPRTTCVVNLCTVSFEGTNILTTNYLQGVLNAGQKHRVGIIMSDFPGAGLIRNVIAMNPWNSPPVANAGGPYVANEGSAITFNAGASTDPNGDPLTYRWDFNNDGVYDTSSSSSPTASTTWHDDYSGTVRVEVSDPYFSSTATASVTVRNVAPTATATGATINENGTATVSGTITDPSSQDTFTVVIDWGEGSPQSFNYPAGSTTFSQTHQYLDDNPSGDATNVYNIGVTAMDDNNGQGTASTTVTVNNVAPVLTVTGDTINENGTATVSGTITDPGTRDTFVVTINWGEGASQTYSYGAGTTTFSETHQYLDDNPTNSAFDVYPIAVSIVDDDKGSDAKNTTVRVNNVAPVLALTGDTINENGTATVSGTITDPGSRDTFVVTINWGEGAPQTYSYGAGTTTFSETHQYLDDNPTNSAFDVYPIAVSIVDDDTGSDTKNTTVRVNNVAPVLALTGDTIDENGTATVSGTFSDPGTLDTFVVTINWGEGNPQSYSYPVGTRSFSETHQYLDDNPTNTALDVYTINVSIVDDDTGSDTESTTVTVNNVYPVTTISNIVDETGETVGTGVRVALTNTQIDLAASFTDVGTQDTHVAAINWDDGSSYHLGPTTGSVATDHIYAQPGVYEILLEVTDDDTGVGPATAFVTVVDAAGGIEELIRLLEDVAGDPTLDPQAAAEIHNALGHLRGQNGGQAADGVLDLLAKKNLNAALVKMWQAMQALEAAEAADAALDLTSLKSLLALIAKSAAMTAILEADAAASTRSEMRKVTNALALIEEADGLLALPDYVDAVDVYREAAQEVQGMR